MYFLSVSLQNPIYASQNEIMPFFTPSPCLSIQVASLLSTFLNLHGYNTSSQKVKLTHNNKLTSRHSSNLVQLTPPNIYKYIYLLPL